MLDEQYRGSCLFFISCDWCIQHYFHFNFLHLSFVIDGFYFLWHARSHLYLKYHKTVAFFLDRDSNCPVLDWYGFHLEYYLQYFFLKFRRKQNDYMIKLSFSLYYMFITFYFFILYPMYDIISYQISNCYCQVILRSFHSDFCLCLQEIRWLNYFFVPYSSYFKF